MKKVLVTGASGYIGSHVCTKLIENGHDVLGIDWNKNFIVPGVDYVYTDYASSTTSQVLAEYQPDIVIHMAASHVVSDSVSKPLEYYHNNVSKMIGFVDQCVKSNVKRFVFSSSAAVYKPTPGALSYSVGDDTDPINPYGNTKLFGEKILNDTFVATGMSYAALRYFNAAGSNGTYGHYRSEVTHAIPAMVYNAMSGKNFHIFGTDFDTLDGTCVRDYIHVSDLADAHLLYALDDTYVGSFNLGTGSGNSVLEVANLVKKELPNMSIVASPRRAGDPPYLVANPSVCFGWKPKYNIDDIVASEIQWFRKRLGI